MLVTIVILLKHIKNLKRIKNSTEARISFRCKGESEIERIKWNMR